MADPLNMSLRQFLTLLADDKPAAKRLRQSLARSLRVILSDHSVREAMLDHLSNQEERIEYDPKHNYAFWVPNAGCYVAAIRVSKSEVKWFDMKTEGEPSYTNKAADSAMARRRAAKIARAYYEP